MPDRCAQCTCPLPPGVRFCGMCGAVVRGHDAVSPFRRTTTILFADLVGSTELGEALDPEPLRDLLAGYFGMVAEVISHYGGHVEKFIGDAVMAVFGVPSMYGDEAVRALRAAARVQRRTAELGALTMNRYGVPIRVRIGINCGQVVVSSRLDGELAVTGDAVNTAARIQTAAPPGGILVSDSTRQLAGTVADLESAPAVLAKGKAEPLTVWRLAAVRESDAPLADALTPLVGRSAQLRLLARALDDPGPGAAAAAGVRGPVGIGKSRLVREYTTALADGSRVLTGHCLAYRTGYAYAPLAEMLAQLGGRDWAGAAEDLLPDTEDGPLVLAKLALATGVGGSGTTSEQEVAWALRRVVEELAADRPLVLVWEDFDAAAPPLVAVIAALMDAPAARRVRFVFVSRQALPEELARRLGGAVDLGPLSESDSLAMALSIEAARATAGPAAEDLRSAEFDLEAHGTDAAGADDSACAGPASPSAALARVVEVSEGVPLYIEQLMSVAEDETVPLSVQALLEAQLDRLGRSERELLNRASVIGRDFGSASLRAVHRGEGAEGMLRTLIRRQVVTVEPQRRGDLSGFRFSHLLLWETAYRTASKEARARWHERLARWLSDERPGGDGLADLSAHHYAAAADLTAEVSGPAERVAELSAEAAAAFLCAALLSQRQGDLTAATTLLGRAQTRLPADAPEQLSIGLRMADCAFQLTGSADARDSLRRTGELLDGNPHWEMLARLRTAVLDTSRDPGFHLRGTRTVEDAEAYFTRYPLDLGRSLTHQLRAYLHLLASRRAEAAAELTLALACAERTGDRMEISRLLALRCELELWSATPVAVATEHCDELLLRSDLDRRQALPVMAVQGVLAALDGDFTTARAMTGAARDIAGELGLLRVSGALSLHSGLVELYDGAYDAAERQFQDGLDYFSRSDERLSTHTLHLALARTLVDRGRPDRAGELLDGLGGRPAAESPNARILMDQLYARVLAARGDHAGAEELARAAVTAALATDDLVSQADTLLDLAEVLHLAGGTGRAAESAARAEELYLRKGARTRARRAAARRAALEAAG